MEEVRAWRVGSRITKHSFHNSRFARRVSPLSNIVCFDRGVAGIGYLTDHGKKLHGWQKEDFEESYNIGRGKLLYEFRNFMMKNIGLDPKRGRGEVKKIVFSKVGVRVAKQSNQILTTHRSLLRSSQHSSSRGLRYLDFAEQIRLAKSIFKDEPDVVVESYTFSDLSVSEQIRIVAESSVLVSAVGGGAMTSMFLQKGAGLILFYARTEGRGSQSPGDFPARLDWDFFNNAAYIRTSWFPIDSMNNDDDLDGLGALLRLEMKTSELHS